MRGSGTRSQAIRLTLSVTVITSIVLCSGQLPDPAAVWALVTDAEPGWLALVVIAEVLSMGAFARLQHRLLLTGGVRVSLRRAFAVTFAGNALSTTLPAGTAVSVVYSFRQFRRSGASAQVATAVILLGGIATSTAYTVIGLLALLGEPHSRLPAGATLAITATGGILIWRSSRSRRVFRGLARSVFRAALRYRRTAPLAHSLNRVRRVMRFSRRDWVAVSAFSLLNWSFEILALIAATKALGIGLVPHQIMLAYFAAQAAGSLLPLLPGGLGAIEAGLVAALVAFGATAVPTSAAVAIYRLVSFWGIVAVGWLAWLVLRASDETSGAAWGRLRDVS